MISDSRRRFLKRVATGAAGGKLSTEPDALWANFRRLSLSGPVKGYGSLLARG